MYRFKIAKNAEDIISVYKRGPQSCMKGKVEVGAYEDSDLSVAYMQNIITKRIAARAVIWPDKKLYFRTYGSKLARLRFNNMLKYRGYTQGRLVGAKIQVYSEYGFPSVDGVRRWEHIMGGYAVIQ